MVVRVSDAVWELMVHHALSTRTFEIMGLLIGEVVPSPAVRWVYFFFALGVCVCVCGGGVVLGLQQKRKRF